MNIFLSVLKKSSEYFAFFSNKQWAQKNTGHLNEMKEIFIFYLPGTPKFYISTNNAQTSHFSISSPTLVVFLLFVCFLIVATLIYVRWYHTVVLLCVFLMSSCSSVGKESACRAGDPGSIPGLGRSPGEGNGNPLQYPCLENPKDREAWWAAVHGVSKSRARLSD